MEIVTANRMMSGRVRNDLKWACFVMEFRERASWRRVEQLSFGNASLAFHRCPDRCLIVTGSTSTGFVLSSEEDQSIFDASLYMTRCRLVLIQSSSASFDMK